MEEELLIENYPVISKPWDIPCIVCDHTEKCSVGNEFNPIGCPWLNHFLSGYTEEQ